MAHVPAAIRYKNPGAMWGRTGKRPPGGDEVPTNVPLAKKWGSVTTMYLHDGLGQGNNIAIFPTFVQGMCAQLDMWRTKPAYKNQSLKNALATWSGGNHVESYIQYVIARVPGITRDTIMNEAFWRSEKGPLFLKAQAEHEAGQKFPVEPGDWTEAQRRVFKSVDTKDAVAKHSTASASATATATAAARAGLPVWAIVLVAAATFAAAVFIWTKVKKNGQTQAVVG